MNRIFISYRRDDSGDAAGRLFDRLEDQFGRDALFMDIDSIPLGVDFRARIDEALNVSAVALIVIGRDWLEARREDEPDEPRRLDDPDDYVRLEVQAALERGVPVIPVLVGGAAMPKASDLPDAIAELATRNAADLPAGPTFRANLDRLVEALSGFITPRRTHTGHQDSGGVELPITFAALQEDASALCGFEMGAYTVTRVLATGGSGIAYLARNPRLGQKICVKVSFPVLSDIGSIKKAIERGVRGIVSLNHPHIARIHEFDALRLQDGSSFYIAMDYVEGQDLGDWTRSLGDDRETFVTRLRLAHLLATTFADAHQCRYTDKAGFEMVGVLHGDIKPGNIIVRPNGEPAILDFMLVDIQRVLDPFPAEENALDNDSDASTQAFGTPGYMAPEQERRGVVTARSDIYGLGCTFIALFYGDFRVQNLAEVVRSDRPLDKLIHRMISDRPENRPPSMRQVAADLESIAREDGIAIGSGALVRVDANASAKWWKRILGRRS